MNEDHYLLTTTRVSPGKRTETPQGEQLSVERPVGRRCMAERALNVAMLLPLVLSALAALAHFSKPIMLTAAILVGVLGQLYLLRVWAREADRRYSSDREMRGLLLKARRFGVGWICCGIGLGIFVLMVHVPFAQALLGALLGGLIFLKGLATEGDIAAREEKLRIGSGGGPRGRIWADRISRMPLLKGAAHLCRRRTRIGDVGLGLATMLLAIVCAATIFIGLAIGEAVVFVKNESASSGSGISKRRSGQGDNESSAGEGSGSQASDVPTYAEHCPQVPDPLAIHHGLGKLFRRVGALIAGCGDPERSVSDLGSTWYAEGTCSDKLRSLGVVSPDYAPVMLFGAGADFAQRAAHNGELVFADVAEPGGGVVYAVGTSSGTFFFAGSSPVFGLVPADAKRCTEVQPTDSLTELAPSLALGWLCQIERTGWAWPIVDTDGSITFLDDNSDELVASSECDDVAACEFEAAACEGPGEVTLGELAEHMPPRLEGL